MMNYVKIKDKEYPVIFNRAAIARWTRDAGIPISEMENQVDMDLLSLYQLCYAGIREGCRREKRPFDIASVDDLIDLLEADQAAGGNAEDLLGTFIEESQPVEKKAEKKAVKKKAG